MLMSMGLLMGLRLPPHQTPRDLPTLSCTPDLLRRACWMPLNISKMRTEGCRDGLSLQGSRHGGGGVGGKAEGGWRNRDLLLFP